jgi:hypothetical protein
MKVERIVVVVIAIAGILAIGERESAAQGRGRGADAGNTKVVETKPDSRNGGFGAQVEKIIRDWFSNKSNLSGLPPGLAKRETLPPGLQKQLVRNGTLPPGLQQKIQPLPRDLEIRLPRLPDGWRRVVIAGNVILLDEKTSAILDVLERVF